MYVLIVCDRVCLCVLEGEGVFVCLYMCVRGCVCVYVSVCARG